MSLTPFHKFLIKERVFCEFCTAPVQATQVVKDENNRERVTCDEHASPVRHFRQRTNQPNET